ncbi:hypothetical protein [Nocardia sp. NBC_01329]|uniref:hypothetical protein n=1 Tax=Nocardia sp. NBC_01329 TaxID=2903594 RepID=UPI002E12C277|nr:hypothetical protein OG405_06840 [Nocardia sp. NBC_01329]
MFTPEESRELAAEYLADIPDLVARRDNAAAVLELQLPQEAQVSARLREVAVDVGKDVTLIFTPEGEPYAPLFMN